MSWEIAVQAWVYSIVGFVVGVLLTFLIFVLPLRRRLRRQAAERAAPHQADAAPAGTVLAGHTATAEPVPAAGAEPPRTPEPQEQPPAAQPAPTAFAPAQQEPEPAAYPVPPESPEEQTLVFDFGGPDSHSQTRHFEDDDDIEPWRPTVDIDPDDRLGDQLPQRTRQPAYPPPLDHTGEPGMFDASMPVPDVEAPPARERQTPIEQRLAGDSPWEPPEQPTDLTDEPADRGSPGAEPPAAEPADWEPDEPAVPDEPAMPDGPAVPDRPAVPDGPALPDEAGGDFRFLPGPDGEQAPPRHAGEPVSDTADTADTAAGEDGEPARDVPAGPFGPGSALPRADGSAPSEEFGVKARTSSMVFHTSRSPFFDRLLPQVWFRTEDDATRAGFTSWERPATP